MPQLDPRAWTLPAPRSAVHNGYGAGRRQPAHRHGEIPMAGRDSEFGLLRSAWSDALCGDRVITFLRGEPGIGKTRLAFEIGNEVRAAGGSVLYGCADEDPARPYEPFLQVLHQLATARETPGGLSASVQEVLTYLLPTGLGGPAAGPPGSADAATQRLMLFEGIRAVLIEASRQAPLLLVLDDLHWADGDSVRLLRYLARGRWGTAALLLGIFRDTEVTTSAPPLRAAIADLHSEGAVEQIELHGLDAESVLLLAEREGLTPEQAAEIFTASGANPFFVLELIAAARMKGADPRSPAVPVAARDVIGRRLARLSAGCNVLLSRASILGPSIEPALLRSVWEGDERNLASAVGEAVAAGLLVEVEGQYRFPHALIQKTLYEGLVVPERESLHLRAGRAIAQRTAGKGTAHAAALAGHFRKAGTTAPPGEALPHALAAAETASASHALDEAISWWEWALELMEIMASEPISRARVLERMAGVLDANREQARAVRYLTLALSCHEATGDQVGVAKARGRLAGAMANGNLRGTNLVTARAHFSAAVSQLGDPSQLRSLAAVHANWAILGVSSFCVDDLQHAAVAQEASPGSDAMTRMNRISEGSLAYHLGGLDEALPHFSAAWLREHERGDHLQSGAAAFMIAIYAQRLCDPGVAISWLRRELDGWPAPSAAAPWGIAARLVSALADAGDWPAIYRLLREHTARDAERIEVMVEQCAIAHFEGAWEGAGWDEAEAAVMGAASREDHCSYQNLGHWLVRAMRARGEPGRAIAILDQELEWSVAGGSRAQELVALAELAVLHAEGGAASTASEYVRRARQIFASDSVRRGLEAKLILAEAITTAERPAVADALFQAAIQVARRYSTPWLEARAFEDWAAAVERRKGGSRAPSIWREAEAVYRRISAGDPWLARLAALAAGHPAGRASSRPDGLTMREVEVLRLIAAGASSREVGEQLVLSVRTVERHIANAYLKTGTHNRAQMTAYALAHGLAAGQS